MEFPLFRRIVIPSSVVLLDFSLVRIFNLSITHPYLFCEKQVFTFPKRSLGFKTVTSVASGKILDPARTPGPVQPKNSAA